MKHDNNPRINFDKSLRDGTADPVYLEAYARDQEYVKNKLAESLNVSPSEVTEYMVENTMFSSLEAQDNSIITVYFSEGAIDYMMEGTLKDKFKKFLVGAANPKYAPLTSDQLADIEGLQATYSAEHLGTPTNTIPIKLSDDIEISKHAQDQMVVRDIPRDHLQMFINHSMFMFIQNNGQGRLYVASGGSIVISVRDNPDGMVVTVYSVKDYYSDKLGPIVEEVKKWVKPRNP